MTYDELRSSLPSSLIFVRNEPYLQRTRALSSADTSLIFSGQNGLDVIVGIHIYEI